MIRRPPRSTRTAHTLSLHDALPISEPAIPPLGRAHATGLAGPPAQPARHARGRRAGTGRACDVLTAVGTTNFTNERGPAHRSEEHTSELQSLMRTSYAVICLKQKTTRNTPTSHV